MTNPTYRLRLKESVRTKVLIIEDSDDQWTLIQRLLEQSLPELVCTRVSSSAHTLALLEKWTIQEWELPKLILQDLYLPTREEGWHLVEQIKAMAPVCQRIPLIMLSSSSDPDDVRTAYRSGVASYLTKPHTLPDWLDCFSQLRRFWWDTVTLPPAQFSV